MHYRLLFETRRRVQPPPLSLYLSISQKHNLIWQVNLTFLILMKDHISLPLSVTFVFLEASVIFILFISFCFSLIQHFRSHWLFLWISFAFTNAHLLISRSLSFFLWDSVSPSRLVLCLTFFFFSLFLFLSPALFAPSCQFD